MAYLYQLALNENTQECALYDYIEVHKIIERTLVVNKSSTNIFYDCKYIRNNRKHKKRVSVEEGSPIGRALAFYLNDRDDDKAIAIFKEHLLIQHKERRIRLYQEGKRYAWETVFVESLSTDDIDEKRSIYGKTKRSKRNKTTNV